MPRLAANLTMMYTEHPFLDRYAAAARDGFSGVEFLFPYEFAAAELKSRLEEHGLTQALFNAPPGDWEAGERGIACLPGREAEFAEGIAQALAYAKTLQCPRVHVMAGLLPAGQGRDDVRATYVANLRLAAREAAKQGVDILIEPINLRDMPGYFLHRQEQAHALLDAVQAGNLKVQMDLYHCQIVEGDVATRLRQYLPTGRVAHLQIAGVPARHEPDQGELHYPYLFDTIDALGYGGWVGCEYRPAAGTSEGLGWWRNLR